MNSDWWYAEHNERIGPVAFHTLIGLIRDGNISPDTLVWHTGMAAWKKAFLVPQLKAYFTNTPPPLEEMDNNNTQTSSLINAKSKGIELTKCGHCDHAISITALICPFCYTPTSDPSNRESTTKKLAKGAAAAAAVVAMGPAAIAGMLVYGPFMFATSDKHVVTKYAKKYNPIDFIWIGDDDLALITEDMLHIVNRSFSFGKLHIPLTNVVSINLDLSKANKSFLFRVISIRITYHSDDGAQDITKKSVFTGKNAKELSEYALLKLHEYIST